MAGKRDFEIVSRAHLPGRVIPPSGQGEMHHLGGEFTVVRTNTGEPEVARGPLCNVDGRAVRSKTDHRAPHAAEWEAVSTDALLELRDAERICGNCLRYADLG